jgi:PAS domain S-box-containing protein
MPENLEALSPDAVRRALHELRVHQIELEMQNVELRRAQEELEGSRARYFDLYDLAPVGYFTLSERGLILEANLTAAKLLGVARGALVKQPLSHFILPEDQDIHYRHFKPLLETGTPQSWELRLLRKDAAPFWARVEAATAQDADAAFVCRVVVSDISESKRAEDALRESEEKYRQLFESMSEGFLLVEMILGESGKPVSFRYLDANPALENLTRLKKQEIIGKDVREVLPEIERYWIETFGQVAITGEPMHIEEFSKDLNGWFEVYAYSPEPGKTAVIYTNVSERRVVREALRASEERFRVLSEAMPQIVWSADATGAVDYFNPQALDYTGIRLEKGIGWNWLSIIHPDDLALTESVWRRTVASGQPCQIEHRLRRADGEFRWHLTRCVPVRNQKSEAIRWISSATDIHAQKTLEQGLEASNKELDAFSYSISHDLRAPLRAIDGFSSMLLEKYRPQLPAEAQEYLDLIRQSALRMGGLIDGLLALSRLGRQELKKQTVVVSDIVRESIDDLRADCEGRAVEFVLGTLPACQADPLLLRQVFANLLSNGLKYTRKREKARIEVGALKFGQVSRQGESDKAGRVSPPALDPECWVYYVRDNGVGIDMRYANRLFGVFQRLHSEKDFEGTGVGLATVQRIIHRHGGQVWAEAAVDKGAAFYFTIGASPGETTRPPSAAAA